MKNYKNKFTLLELLVVMVVCLILLAISTPAFLSMSKGQSVDIAARNFGSEILALRNYAITNRQAVALIIPTTQNDIPSEYLYKSYCPCILDDNMNFDRWIEGEKLEFLPTGTAIIDITNETTINNINFELISIETDNSSSEAIIFNERGVPVPNNQNNSITIGDAAYLQKNVSSVENKVMIEISRFTGRVIYH